MSLVIIAALAAAIGGLWTAARQPEAAPVKVGVLTEEGERIARR